MRRGGGGPVYVRSPISGQPIPCCWDDCMRPGDDRCRIVLREGPKTTIMIFCSEPHKQMHLHSTVRYGGVPPGYRSLLN